MQEVPRQRSQNTTALIFQALYSVPVKTKLSEDLIEVLVLNFDERKWLAKQFGQVEIIDDEVELQLFAIVNGVSKEVPLLSRCEAEKKVRKALKYIGNQDSENLEVNREGFEAIRKYVEDLTGLFTQQLRHKKQYR